LSYLALGIRWYCLSITTIVADWTSNKGYLVSFPQQEELSTSGKPLVCFLVLFLLFSCFS